MGIERLREVTGEVESTFGVENGAHSFADIRAIDPQITNDQLMHEIAENQQRITQFAGYVLGRKSNSRFSFGAYLRGDGTALATGVAPVDDTLQDLLTLSMGGTEDGEGSTFAAGSTTTVVNVQAGDGLEFTAGQAVMCEGTGDNGENEISVIDSISTDALTLKTALSNAPSENDTIWNSYTAYIDPSATNTWQFQALGDDAADIWLLLGCVGGFSFQDLLQTEASQLPRINFDMMVTSWEKDSGTMAAGSYDAGDLLGTTEGMEIHYQTVDSTARNLISVSSLDVQPNIVWTPLVARGNADVQHIDRIRMTDVAPQASFVADPAAAFWTAHTAQTEKYLMITFGRTAGQSWCIEIPRAVIMAAPSRSGHAEQPATSVSLRAIEDNTASTAIGRSPIRLHRL